MGVGCQFLFCGPIALLGGLAFLWGAVQITRGAGVKSLPWIGCGGLAAIAGTGWIVMWLLAMQGSESTDRRVFETSFGFPAPDSVSEVRSFYASSTDWFLLCMRFDADEATIDRMVKETGYESDPSGWLSCDRDLTWWDPSGQLELWSKEPFYENSSGGGEAILGCPPSAGPCYLVAWGVE